MDWFKLYMHAQWLALGIVLTGEGLNTYMHKDADAGPWFHLACRLLGVELLSGGVGLILWNARWIWEMAL